MPLTEYVERMEQLRAERIAELSARGVVATKGQCLGAINIDAGQVVKLLKLLKRADRLARKEST